MASSPPGALAHAAAAPASSTRCSTPSSTAGGRHRRPRRPARAVTIATNMAGRGTDIKLNGEASGGLYVIGTERHESRRIDRQLRGRCSRQATLASPSSASRWGPAHAALPPGQPRLPVDGRLDEGGRGAGAPVAQPLDRERAEKRSSSRTSPPASGSSNMTTSSTSSARSSTASATAPSTPSGPRTSSSSRSPTSCTTASGSPASAGRPHAIGPRGPGRLGQLHFPITLPRRGSQGQRHRRAGDAHPRSNQAGLRDQGEPRVPGPSARSSLTSSSAPCRSPLAGTPLTEMEDLRKSMSALRSRGQKDPLGEYKGAGPHRVFPRLMANDAPCKICTGLFRGASDLESFENMLALLSRTARTPGPRGRAVPAIPAKPRSRRAAPGSAAAARRPADRDRPAKGHNPPRDAEVGRNDPALRQREEIQAVPRGVTAPRRAGVLK